MTKKKETLMSFVLLIIGLVWGFGFIAVQRALDSGFSPSSINFFRFFVASILTFIAFPKSILSIKFKEIKAGLIPSIAMAAGFFFQNLGQKYTTPGNNALITGAYTILVPFFLALFFKRKPRKLAYVAAVITFAGIVILSLPSFSAEDISVGDFLSLLAAIFFASQFITLETALKKCDSKKMTFIQMATCAVLFLIVFLCTDLNNVKSFDFGGGIWAILYLGAFSSFLAYVVQTYAQKYIAPTRVAILLSSESLFGAVLSVLFGYENLTLYLVIGGILALIGIVLSQLPAKQPPQTTVEKAEITPENGNAENNAYSQKDSEENSNDNKN